MRQDIQSLFSVCEVELIYRNKVKPSDRHVITRPSSAYALLLEAWDMNRIELVEDCYLLMLDQNKTVLGLSHIATGGVTGCIVDPKIVFATALKAKACAIILAHNHPSGNLLPSLADKAMTNRLVQAGDLLDIAFNDHLIVTPTSYYSFADEGLIL